MQHRLSLLLVIIFLLALPLAAQESEKSEEGMSMMPPKPLADDWHKWLVGEWEGESETTMGKTKDWMKVEWGPGKQFLVMHYKGKTIEVNEEMAAKAAEQMNMPMEQFKKMMMQDYYGLGVTTVNPQNGELMGYWFDSYRDISQGSGELKDSKSTMTWKSSAMGSMKRIVEKVSKDKMKVKMHGKDPAGMEWEGTATMQRKK